MMRRLLSALLLLPLLVATTAAQTTSPEPAAGRAPEPYYFSFAFGVAATSYPADTRALIDDLARHDDVARIPIDGEIGVSWPVFDEMTTLGPSMRATGDHLTRGDESISFNVMSLAASARRYFTGVIGDGPFGRVDAGVAFAGVSHYIDGTPTGSRQGEFGLHAGLGAGWSFPLSSGTSLEIAAAGSYRSLPGHETGQKKRGELFERGNYLAGSVGVGLFW